MPPKIRLLKTPAECPCEICGEEIPADRIQRARDVSEPCIYCDAPCRLFETQPCLPGQTHQSARLEIPKYCSDRHAGTARARRRRDMYGTKPTTPESSRRRLARVRAAGLCVLCKLRPAVPVEGSTILSTCEECRDAGKARRRLKKLLASARAAVGDPPAADYQVYDRNA